MTIDEAIAHAREAAKEKRKEMQCKTCKLFVRSDLHPLQGYCRKNEFRSIEIDSWSKVCSEYVSKEMCKYAEEHEQLAEWLEELKSIKENSISKEAFEKMKSKAYKKGHRQGYNKAIDDFADKIIDLCDDGEFMNRFNEFPATTILEIAEQLREGVEDGNNE